MRRFILASLFCTYITVATSLPAANKTIHLQVGAAESDRENVPVTVTLMLPQELADVDIARLKAGDDVIWGQLTGPSLLAEKDKKDDAGKELLRELHFILPKVEKGKTLSVEATIDTDGATPAEEFAWGKEEETHVDLAFAGRPVARYMKESYDNSTPANRERTYKVYHHVYHPKTGTLLTKGPGGQYTHHRGIFYGFSKVSYGPDLGKKADIWHCSGGVSQRQAGMLGSAAGPVLARQRLAISWVGGDNQLFAREYRELTFFNTPGGLLVEFASMLQAADGKLKLDGDPQHAGFQFRASNDVSAKTANQTYYIRPDGAAKPGNYKQGQQQLWNAMSFVLGDDRYTTCYLDHPDNPKPAFYSERNYGRFGSYFVAQAEGEETIDVNYRLWIQPGEMTVEQVAAQAEKFVEPLNVRVK